MHVNEEGLRPLGILYGPPGTKRNRSPKGNTWSAIPVALLCMVETWIERQGSGPNRDKVL